MKDMEKNKYLDIIDVALLSLIAVMITLYSRVVPVLMLVLFFSALLRKSTYERIPIMLKNFNFWILISPFLLIVIGYFYSSNKVEGYRSVETAASLIFFVVIYFLSISQNRYPKHIGYILRFFILGIVLAYAILLINAIPLYLETKDSIVLFYTKFSAMLKPPNHLSYNVLFAIVICLVELLGETKYVFEKKTKLTTAACILIFVVLSMFLFQLVSKSTIIIYFIILFIALIYACKRKIIKIYFLLILILAVGGISSYMFTIPRFKHRFDNLVTLFTERESIDYSQKESSTLRISAIKASFEIIEENWLFGVGTGDVVDELEKHYQENDYQGAMAKHTNPHNQFVRSFVSLGIFGFISILLVFFVLAKTSINNRSLLGFLYFVMMAFVFLFDDMLIFRDGVLFFSLFAPYFVFCEDSIMTGVINNDNEIFENLNDAV